MSDNSSFVPNGTRVARGFVVTLEIYCVHYTYLFDLVSAAVPETTFRCTTEVINIKRATVSHLNVVGPIAVGIIATV